MKLRVKKVLKQIKEHKFGQTILFAPDPGHRRAVHAPMCIR